MPQHTIEQLRARRGGKRREEHLYLVGMYRYRDMKRPRLACVRLEDADTLPPTMLHPIRHISAPNREEAIRKYRMLHKPAL